MTLKGYLILVLVEAAIFAAGTGLVSLRPQWEAVIWLSVAGVAVVAIPVVLLGPAVVQLLRANAETLATMAVMGAILGGLGWGLFGGVRWLMNRPPPEVWEWVHPTTSLEEQTMSRAECRMLSVEAASGPSFAESQDQRQYLEACLISRGFTYQQVPDSN